MNQDLLSWLTSTLLADVGARTLPTPIHALNPAWKVFGPALTVQVPPGDNLAIHLALSIAAPGDVLVVDGAGYADRALMGDIMCTQAAASGIAGIVIDGAIRDINELRAAGLPVFARGASPNGPFKKGDGTVAMPIVCGSAPVRAGDWILGDADGVVVLPIEQKDTLIAAAAAKLEKEQARLQAIGRGELLPPWLADAVGAARIRVGNQT